MKAIRIFISAVMAIFAFIVATAIYVAASPSPGQAAFSTSAMVIGVFCAALVFIVMYRRG